MTDQLAADGVDDESIELVDDATLVDDSEPEDSGGGSEAVGRRKQPRVSRWDRPPEPHDWRFYVGGTGKTLIALGLLTFGFVAYQLWGTGIETARAQNQLENEFDTLLAEFGDAESVASTDTTESAGGAESQNDPAVRATAENPEPSAANDASDSSEAPLEEPTFAADADDGAATAIPVAVDLSDEAVVQDPIPQPFRGDPLLRLEIPEIGRDDIVVPGVSLNDLKDGPGHYPDTPLPGQLGNAAIAGHRTTYGAPFYNVDQLAVGDEIITTLLNGDRFVYEVTHVEVVAATDYWVVATTDPNIAELTLTSCHPKYTARDRIVVHSVLNPAKSSNVGVPTFYSLEAAPDDAPIPGDDPVLTAAAPDQPAESGDVGVTEAEADGDTAGAPATDGAVDPVADAGGDPTTGGSPDRTSTESGGVTATDTPAEAPTPIDAFEEGWFDDARAFPQITLWGLVLALISVLAYQIAKRFRRLWVGVTLGILPLLVALYFFYQNVNRLLPAGI